MQAHGQAPSANRGNLTISVEGEYDVTYFGQSGTGIYEGTWGNGGTEQLIPASPIWTETKARAP